MCIANICKIKKILKDNKADVDYSGLEDTIDIRFIEDITLGDYVLVHAGFAIQKIDKEEALKMIKIAKEAGL
ncbi:HypC/HybG/HupF family hydrogenase formation chaperone [Elusimicrobiota bacterium]